MFYKIICRADKVNKSGESPLFLQFYHDGRRKMLATGISISAHFWDDKTQQILPECPNRDELQYKLREQIRTYDKKIRRLEALDIPVTFENLLERASNCHRITIQEVFTSEIKRLEALGKINSDNAENGKVCPR